MTEAKTEAIKDLPEVEEEDQKIDMDWDKDKYKVAITEWTKQGHIVYKLKVSQHPHFSGRRLGRRLRYSAALQSLPHPQDGACETVSRLLHPSHSP